MKSKLRHPPGCENRGLEVAGTQRELGLGAAFVREGSGKVVGPSGICCQKWQKGGGRTQGGTDA